MSTCQVVRLSENEYGELDIADLEEKLKVSLCIHIIMCTMSQIIGVSFSMYAWFLHGFQHKTQLCSLGRLQNRCPKAWCTVNIKYRCSYDSDHA